MRTFSTYIPENTLYKDAAERTALLANEEQLAISFLYNFLGVFGLFNGAKNQTAFTNYFKHDKQLRVDKINDDNNDMSLIIKLVNEAGYFRVHNTINEITRLLFKLKSGGVTSIDDTIVRTWCSHIIPGKFQLKLPMRLRRPLIEFIGDGKTGITLEQLALRIRVYKRLYNVGTEYLLLSKQKQKNDTKTISVQTPAAVQGGGTTSSAVPVTPPAIQAAVSNGVKKTTIYAAAYRARQSVIKSGGTKAAADAAAAAVVARMTSASANVTPVTTPTVTPAAVVAPPPVVTNIQTQINQTVAAVQAMPTHVTTPVVVAAPPPVASIKASDVVTPANEVDDDFAKWWNNTYNLVSTHSVVPADYYKDEIKKGTQHEAWVACYLAIGIHNEYIRSYDIMGEIKNRPDIKNLIADVLSGKYSGQGMKIDLNKVSDLSSRIGSSNWDVWSDLLKIMSFDGFKNILSKFEKEPAGLNTMSAIQFLAKSKVIENVLAIYKDHTLEILDLISDLNTPKNGVYIWSPLCTEYSYGQYDFDKSADLQTAVLPKIFERYNYDLMKMIQVHKKLRASSRNLGLVVPKGNLQLLQKAWLQKLADSVDDLEKLDDKLKSLYITGDTPAVLRVAIAYTAMANGQQNPKAADLLLSRDRILNSEKMPSWMKDFINTEVNKNPELFVRFIDNDSFVSTIKTKEHLDKLLTPTVMSRIQTRRTGGTLISTLNRANTDDNDTSELLTHAFFKFTETGGNSDSLVRQGLDYGWLSTVSSNAPQKLLQNIIDRKFSLLHPATMSDAADKHLKPKIKQVLAELLTENVDKGNTKEVDNFFDSFSSAYYRSSIMGQMIGFKVIIEEVQSGPIKPFDKIDTKRMKQILSFNDLDASEIEKQVKIRKGKSEKMSAYIKRAQESVTSFKALKPLAVVEVAADQKTLDATTVQIVKDTYAGRHGEIHPKIEKILDVHLPDDEFQAFKAIMLKRGVSPIGVTPAFHGTGGIAAAMILRYGFKVLKAGDPSVVGRMLGDGIYFASNIDKSLQYVGNSGYGRNIGTRGYIFSMESVLGDKGYDYNSAGDTGRDGIRSPEWMVKDARKQLKIIRAYQVQLISKSEYYKIASRLNEHDGRLMKFKEYLSEAVLPSQHKVVYTFWDGIIPVPNKQGDLEYVDFEAVKKLPSHVKIVKGRNGPSVEFLNAKETEFNDVRYAKQMERAYEKKYIELWNKNN